MQSTRTGLADAGQDLCSNLAATEDATKQAKVQQVRAVHATNVNRSRRDSRTRSDEDGQEPATSTPAATGRPSGTPASTLNQQAPEWVPGATWPGVGESPRMGRGRADVLRDLETTGFEAPQVLRGGFEATGGVEPQHRDFSIQERVQDRGLVQDLVQTSNAPPAKKASLVVLPTSQAPCMLQEQSQEELLHEHEDRDKEASESPEETIRRLKEEKRLLAQERDQWRDGCLAEKKKHHNTHIFFRHEEAALQRQIGILRTNLDSSDATVRQLDQQVWQFRQSQDWQRGNRHRGNGRSRGNKQVSYGYLKRSLEKEERNSRRASNMAEYWQRQWEATDSSLEGTIVQRDALAGKLEEKKEIVCFVSYHCLLQDRGLPKHLAELTVKFVPLDALDLHPGSLRSRLADLLRRCNPAQVDILANLGQILA